MVEQQWFELFDDRKIEQAKTDADHHELTSRQLRKPGCFPKLKDQFHSTFRSDHVNSCQCKEGIPNRHLATFGNKHFRDSATDRRLDLCLHLHGFYDHDHITLIDLCG